MMRNLGDCFLSSFLRSSSHRRAFTAAIAAVRTDRRERNDAYARQVQFTGYSFGLLHLGYHAERRSAVAPDASSCDCHHLQPSWLFRKSKSEIQLACARESRVACLFTSHCKKDRHLVDGMDWVSESIEWRGFADGRDVHSHFQAGDANG